MPQLQLMIGGKKEDFYSILIRYKTGLNDQSYTLRVGRYGLLDMEFQWDQIPHWFSEGVARTPYAVNHGPYNILHSFLQANCNHATTRLRDVTYMPVGE